MQYDPRRCVACGKDFVPAYASQITCSDACAAERKKWREKQQKGRARERFRESLERLEKEIALLKKENSELREQLALCGVSV